MFILLFDFLSSDQYLLFAASHLTQKTKSDSQQIDFNDNILLKFCIQLLLQLQLSNYGISRIIYRLLESKMLFLLSQLQKKDPGVQQLQKRPGNLKMLSLGYGQNSNNLPKAMGLRGGDVGSRMQNPIFLHMKNPSWTSARAHTENNSCHLLCASTGMGMAWRVLLWPFLKEELPDEVKPSPSFICF